MNTREQLLTFADGATTVLERFGDDGPNLVCVHGLTSSRKGWARFATRFASSYRVYAYDQRGHGDAAAFPGPMSFEQGVADLKAVLGAIPGPIDSLIGHSWGGAIVVLGGLAVQTRTVVAIDPVIHYDTSERGKKMVEHYRPFFALDRAGREAEILKDYGDDHHLDLAGKLHAMLPMQLVAMQRFFTENGIDEGKVDLRERLVDYPLPLYVPLAGVESIVAAEDVAFLRARGGAHVTVREFAGHGHSLHRSAFDAFARTVDAFLTQ